MTQPTNHGKPATFRFCKKYPTCLRVEYLLSPRCTFSSWNLSRSVLLSSTFITSISVFNSFNCSWRFLDFSMYSTLKWDIFYLGFMAIPKLSHLCILFSLKWIKECIFKLTSNCRRKNMQAKESVMVVWNRTHDAEQLPSWRIFNLHLKTIKACYFLENLYLGKNSSKHQKWRGLGRVFHPILVWLRSN